MLLILDSDILWFHQPIEIDKEVERGAERSLMMSNGEDVYIHVEFKDGTKTSERVANANSGIVLYNRENFDFDTFVSYLAKTDYMHKKFTDQACYATILKNLKILPTKHYLIKGPVTNEVVIRHYTSPSRAKFFIYGINLLNKF